MILKAQEQLILMLKVFFSNQLEFLVHTLGDALGESDSIFHKHFVCVPSVGMKNYLSYHIAKQQGICCGPRFGSFETNFQQTLVELFPNQTLPTIMPLQEWNGLLSIDFSLNKIFSQKSVDESSSLFPYYKQWEKATLSGKDYLITSLSQELYYNFKDYITHGIDFFISDTSFSKENQWQYDLFTNCYPKLAENWSQLLKLCQNLPSSKRKVKLSLFAFNYLSPTHWQLIKALSTHVMINLFTLSPCSKFWTDVLTPKEKLFVLESCQKNDNQDDTLDELFREKNRLLSHFAKMGKQSIKLLEEEPYTFEAYFLSSKILEKESYQQEIQEKDYFEHHTKPSLLSFIQHDLVLLRDTHQTSSPTIDEQDISLAIHLCPNKLRESEVLVQNILHFLQQKNPKDEAYLQNILVLAPDIDLYRPYLSKAFKQCEQDLKLTFADTVQHDHLSLTGGLFLFFELLKQRVSNKSLLHFLSSTVLQEKFGWDSEDLELIYAFLENAPFSWGIKEDQKRLSLEQEALYSQENLQVGSLTYALEYKLKQLFTSQSQKNHLDRQASLTLLKKTETLNSFLELASQLEFYCNAFIKKQTRPLSEWIDLCLSMLEAFFLIESHPKTVQEWQSLYKQLKTQVLNNSSDLMKQEITLNRVKCYLDFCLRSRKTELYHQGLASIYCCSMLPMRSIPAKAIFVLGMDYDAFPQKSQTSLLNLLKNKPFKTFSPSLQDADQYLFLETLLSARQQIHFSCSLENSETHDKSCLSPCLQELLHYIDEAFTFTHDSAWETISYLHPSYPFDFAYFNHSSKLFSYDQAAFKLASLRSSPIFLQKPPINIEPKPLPDFIHLSQLSTLTKNPLKHFLTETLGCKISDLSSNTQALENKFKLSSLEKYLVVSSEEYKTQEKWEELNQTSPICSLVFKEIAHDQALEKSSCYASLLQNILGSDPILFSLYLNAATEMVYETPEKHKIGPALQVPFQDQIITIEGKFSHLSSKGLVLFCSLNIENFYKHLPEILSFFCLDENLLSVEKKVIFLESQNSIALDSKLSFSYLIAILHHFIEASSSLCAIYPSWIKPLFDQDEEAFLLKLQQEIKSPTNIPTNPYISFCHRNHPDIFIMENILKKWSHPFIKMVFECFDKACESLDKEALLV